MTEVSLSDGVIILTPFHRCDAAAHLAGEDADMERWLSGGPGSPERLAAYFQHVQRQWTIAGPLRHFGIHLEAPEPILVGTIDVQFEQPELTEGQANIAYGLYPRWRGRGLVSRAVELVCSYAAAEGANEAIIRTATDNPRSAAVARRCGFEYTGRHPDSDGKPHDWFSRGLRP
ncbi:GNAT family N-acetyltransferase [Stackebrandtia nassauensis]|uniref:GCN5-related N-acetyltransferase n=1 Tax=Stackebrandtia nassauensis (strain DSM 44728 / CIP 108903 / NRRL B-16338 / NBRC 102104 / LLR-40K-21) TaxID=446470 RepID=D3Q815_STANL|nr:GNAT family N-acetyltransferase [Stackebrandtia nassauensis]ADD40520.1 GCN5-related N-acetyltransferase [Stackebrandtia nassauensis DSM 44728]